MQERAEAVSVAKRVAFLDAGAGVDQVIERHTEFVFLTADFAAKAEEAGKLRVL